MAVSSGPGARRCPGGITSLRIWAARTRGSISSSSESASHSTRRQARSLELVVLHLVELGGVHVTARDCDRSALAGGRDIGRDRATTRARGRGSDLLQERFDDVGHQHEVLQLAGRVAGGAVGGDHRIVVGHGLPLGPEGAGPAFTTHRRPHVATWRAQRAPDHSTLSPADRCARSRATRRNRPAAPTAGGSDRLS